VRAVLCQSVTTLFACSQVNEEDLLLGLWRKRCNSDQSKTALSLLQWGNWDKAEALLGELNNNAAGQQIMVRHSRQPHSMAC
jgi:hypothetical protein